MKFLHNLRTKYGLETPAEKDLKRKTTALNSYGLYALGGGLFIVVLGNLSDQKWLTFIGIILELIGAVTVGMALGLQRKQK